MEILDGGGEGSAEVCRLLHCHSQSYIDRNETLLELNAELPRIAIRAGDMKLVVDGRRGGAGDWTEPPEHHEGEQSEGEECAEEDTNYAGYGIKANKVNFYN